jgi:DNA-binding CsgD family transcriptional regulator
MAHRLAAVCGGAVTPALRNTTDHLPLTPREREIANLVAAGLSNSAIAERLYVSVRTVEGHIYRAFTKLDLASRDELAALVQQPPPSP